MDKQDKNLNFCDLSAESRLRINRLGRFYCTADWSWDSAGVSDWKGYRSLNKVQWNFDLWTVLQGHGTLQVGNQTYPISSGDCFILKKGQRCIGRNNPDDPLVVVAVHYDYLDETGQVIFPETTRLHRRIQNLEFFSHLLERLEAAWLESENCTSDATLWLAACLAEIDRQDRELQWHGYQKKQAELIETICWEIRHNPKAQWCIEELATRLHCTRYHFSRLFRQFKGMSPREFLTKVRIEAAKNMLHVSNHSIGRIATEVGFNSIYYFSRHFKKSAGVSPLAYRNQTKG